VTRNFRRRLPAIVAFLGALVSSSAVLAEDYSVDFGVKTGAGKDASTIKCRFGEMCAGTLESLGFRVSIYITRNETERATVDVYSGDTNCCYFDGTADKTIMDPRKSLFQIPFFRGVRPRGALFVKNELVGMLYLKFNFRDHL
jgi:hypothetical protein